MRSCHASAYGQWLQVKTTSVARACSDPPTPCSAPSVSGSVNVGAWVPMSVLIDGSWWSSRCGGRRARRPGRERVRRGRRGDGRRGRSAPWAPRPGPGCRRRRCGSWASRRSARGRRAASVSTSRTRTWSGSSPSSAIAARSSSSACGCDGQPSQNSSSTCGCVISGRLGDGPLGPGRRRRAGVAGGASSEPGHEHLFVRSPLYSDHPYQQRWPNDGEHALLPPRHRRHAPVERAPARRPGAAVRSRAVARRGEHGRRLRADAPGGPWPGALRRGRARARGGGAHPRLPPRDGRGDRGHRVGRRAGARGALRGQRPHRAAGRRPGRGHCGGVLDRRRPRRRPRDRRPRPELGLPPRPRRVASAVDRRRRRRAALHDLHRGRDPGQDRQQRARRRPRHQLPGDRPRRRPGRGAGARPVPRGARGGADGGATHGR